MSTAMQTIPEGTLADKLDDIEHSLENLEKNQKAIIDGINELIELANQLSSVANSFSGNIPAPLKAMLGM